MDVAPRPPRPRLAVRRRKAPAIVVIVLLIGGIGAALPGPALATVSAAEVRLSRSEGPPGTELTMSGRGYQPLEIIDVYEDTNPWTTATADGSGRFSIPLRICTCFGPATINVKGVGETSGLSAQAPFTIRTNWPQFRMTPEHHGYNRFENVISTASVSAMLELWSGPTNNYFTYSSAVVSGGLAYVGSGDHNLYVFDAAGCGGQAVCPALWTGATGGYIDSTPAVAGKTVFVGSDDGLLYAFPAEGCGLATCQPIWTATTGGSIHGSPVVSRRFVYVVSGDGLLHVFRARGCGAPTCQDVWTGDLQGHIPTGSSAAVWRGALYVGAGNAVLAFDAIGCGSSSCAPLWTSTTGGTVFSSPTWADGVVYVGSEDHKLYAMDAVTGLQLWTGATGDVIDASPAVANGRVYVGSFDGGVYAFDGNGCGNPTCGPIWEYGTQGPIFSSPSVANGVLFVVSNDGHLEAFDAAGCGQLVCAPLRKWAVAGEGSPAVSDGQVLVSGQDGSLHTFGFPSYGRVGSRP